MGQNQSSSLAIELDAPINAPAQRRSSWRRFCICNWDLISSILVKATIVVAVSHAFTKSILLVAHQYHFKHFIFSRKAWGDLSDLTKSSLCLLLLGLWFTMTTFLDKRHEEHEESHEPSFRMLPQMDRLWLIGGGGGMCIVGIASITIGRYVRALLMIIFGLLVFVPSTFEVTGNRRYKAAIMFVNRRAQFIRWDNSYWVFAIPSLLLYGSSVCSWMLIPDDEVSDMKNFCQRLPYGGELFFMVMISSRPFVYGLLMRNFVRAFEIHLVTEFDESTRLQFKQQRQAHEYLPEELRAITSRVDLRSNLSNKRVAALSIFAQGAIILLAVAQFAVHNEWFWFVSECLFLSTEVFIAVWAAYIFWQLGYGGKPPVFTSIYLVGKLFNGILIFGYEFEGSRFSWYRSPDILEWAFAVNIVNILIFLILCCTRIETHRRNRSDARAAAIRDLQSRANSESERVTSESRPPVEDSDSNSHRPNANINFFDGWFSMSRFLVVCQIYHQCMIWRILIEQCFYTMKYFSQHEWTPLVHHHHHHHGKHMNIYSRVILMVTMLSLEFHLEMIKMAMLVRKMLIDGERARQRNERMDGQMDGESFFDYDTVQESATSAETFFHVYYGGLRLIGSFGSMSESFNPV